MLVLLVLFHLHSLMLSSLLPLFLPFARWHDIAAARFAGTMAANFPFSSYLITANISATLLAGIVGGASPPGINTTLLGGIVCSLNSFAACTVSVADCVLSGHE